MAIAASRLLGADAGGVGYVTRVGNDAFGGMLLELWRQETSIPAAWRSTGRHDRRLLRHARPQGHEFAYLRAG